MDEYKSLGKSRKMVFSDDVRRTIELLLELHEQAVGVRGDGCDDGFDELRSQDMAKLVKSLREQDNGS